MQILSDYRLIYSIIKEVLVTINRKASKLVLLVIFQVACLNLIFTYSNSFSDLSSMGIQKVKLMIGISALIFFCYKEISLARSK